MYSRTYRWLTEVYIKETISSIRYIGIVCAHHQHFAAKSEKTHTCTTPFLTLINFPCHSTLATHYKYMTSFPKEYFPFLFKTFYWSFLSFISCIYPPPLQTSLPIINTHTHTHTHTHKHTHYTKQSIEKISAVVCHTVSHNISLCPHILQLLFIAMSHWSGSRSLASVMPLILDPHWVSFQLSCYCPVSWRSCSNCELC